MHWKSVVAGGIISLVAFSVSTSNAADATSTTTVGTAKSINQLVKASNNINVLPAQVASELATSGSDTPERLFPSVGSSCVGGPGCTFGDKSSRQSIVLFGDSHALMWLPALSGFAKTNHYKLIVMWAPGKCAVALLPSNYSYSGIPNSGCSAWHRQSVTFIQNTKPALVLLGERTSDVYSEPGNLLFSDVTWRSSLEKAIREIATTRTKVAVIEDVVNMSSPPQTCLAAYPTDIQRQCSTPFPNTNDPGHQQAEKEAAAATGAGFIKTSQWFCTSSCSPVIGSFIPFYDQGHVSATYAKFLSGVFTTAVKANLQ